MNAPANPHVASIDAGVERIALSTFEKIIMDFSREVGRPVSLDLIRSSLQNNAEFARIDDLSDVARVSGLHVRELEPDVFALQESDFPALISHGNEFVVIMRMREDGLADVLEPDGLREGLLLREQVYAHDVDQIFHLEFSGSGTFGRWEWLLKPIRESSWAYGQVIVAAIFINILALSTSVFTMVVYDRVLPNSATESLVALTIGVSIALIFDVLLKMLRGWFLDGAGSRADSQIGEKLFDQLISIDLSAKRESVGGLSSIMREFETLRDFLTSATLAALIDLPFVILFLVVIFILGGSTALVPGILVPLVIIVAFLAQPFLSALAQEAIEQGKNKQSILVESISGIEVLKTSMASKEMRRRWRESLKAQSTSSVKSRIVSQLVVNFSAFAQQIAQVGVVVVGAYQVSSGNLTLGGLIASVILAGRTMAPLSQIASVLTRIVHAKAAFKTLDQFMSLPLDRPPEARYLHKPKMKGLIEFRNVSFSYAGQAQSALKDVSFSIKPGERVAFLGKIGSGKSTAARLMLGLYSPTLGSVLIDETDVRQIDPFDLHKNVSLILQDSWMFSGSVRDNIASGAVRVSDEDFLRSSEIAGVHDFLGEHPNGYDLLLREGGEGLSGGQRQAISIARGLVGEPSVLVMDEPTSMMDMGSETKFVDRLSASLTNQTLIVITHRSAMLKLVDRVIIFDKGRVVADGPKSLLEKKSPASPGQPEKK
jgi:ATP-binding cassette subfamily C protein LapB